MTVKKEPTTVQAAGFFCAFTREAPAEARPAPGAAPGRLRTCPGVVPARSRPGPGHSRGVSRCCPGGNPSRRKSRCCSESLQAPGGTAPALPILSRCPRSSDELRRASPGSRHESPLIRRDPPEVPTPAPLLSKNAKPGGRRYGGRRKGCSVPSATLSRPFPARPAPPSARHLRKPERHVSVLPCSCRRKKPSAGDLFRTDPRRDATPCLPHARMPGPPSFSCPFPDKKKPDIP